MLFYGAHRPAAEVMATNIHRIKYMALIVSWKNSTENVRIQSNIFVIDLPLINNTRRLIQG